MEKDGGKKVTRKSRSRAKASFVVLSEKRTGKKRREVKNSERKLGKKQ